MSGSDIWKSVDDLELGLDPTGDRNEEKSDKEVTEAPQLPLQPRKKAKVGSLCVVFTTHILIISLQKRPHIVWEAQRDIRETYLEEMMQREGRDDFRDSTTCPDLQVAWK